jgi:hypothetical protein
MHRANTGAPNRPPERDPDALMTKTHTKNGDLAGEMTDRSDGDARIVWVSGSGRDHQSLWRVAV